MVLSSRLYSRTQLMRAPLARSLWIVEGPFQDTGLKVFDLVSVFPFSWRFVFFSILLSTASIARLFSTSVWRGGGSRICFKNCNSRWVTEVLNDQSLTFQKMRSHFATGFLRQSTKWTVLNLLRFTLSSLFRWLFSDPICRKIPQWISPERAQHLKLWRQRKVKQQYLQKIRRIFQS